MRTRTSLTALFIPLLICAQVRQGPRIGLAIATQTAGQFLQWQGLPKFGPIIGYSWEIPYTHQVGILIEPTIMSKGSWTQNAPLRINTFITQRYLEMPVLLKLDLDTARIGYFLTGGVIPAYWISGRYKVVQDGNVVTDFMYNLNQPNVRRMQWSLAIGLGNAGERWSWELRGQSSVTPFDRVIRAQNLVFGIHLTYRLLNYEERKARRAKRSGEEEENTP